MRNSFLTSDRGVHSRRYLYLKGQCPQIIEIKVVGPHHDGSIVLQGYNVEMKIRIGLSALS